MQYNCCGILNVVLLSSIYIFSVCFTTDFCLYKVKLSQWKIFTHRKQEAESILVETLRDGTGGLGRHLSWVHRMWFSSLLPHWRAGSVTSWASFQGGLFPLLEPWIPLSQHVSSLSDLPESPGTCEIYNKMLLLPFPSLPFCAQRWGIHGITGGPE